MRIPVPHRIDLPQPDARPCILIAGRGRHGERIDGGKGSGMNGASLQGTSAPEARLRREELP